MRKLQDKRKDHRKLKVEGKKVRLLKSHYVQLHATWQKMVGKVTMVFHSRAANNFPAAAGQIVRSNLFFLGHIPFLAGQTLIIITLDL